MFVSTELYVSYDVDPGTEFEPAAFVAKQQLILFFLLPERIGSVAFVAEMHFLIQFQFRRGFESVAFVAELFFDQKVLVPERIRIMCVCSGNVFCFFCLTSTH